MTDTPFQTEETQVTMTGDVPPSADDILSSTEQISGSLLVDTRERRLGSVLCARKSVSLVCIAKQEALP